MAKQEAFDELQEPITSADLLELRCLSKPPQLVKNILTATLVVLGAKRKYAEDWNNVVIEMKQSGNSSLVERLKRVDPTEVKLGAMKYVTENVIKRYNLEKVSGVSKAVTSLFIWLRRLEDQINELEKAKKKQKLRDETNWARDYKHF